MRRPTSRLAAVVAAATLASSAAACGTQPATTSPSSTDHSAPSQATRSVVDAKDRVACSTTKLPARNRDATIQVRLGDSTATLTGRVGGDRWLPRLRQPRLALTTAGDTVTAVLHSATYGPGKEAPYGVTTVGLDRRVQGYVCLARFGAGPAVALTATYSGGAHCCTALQLVDAAGQVRLLDTGNAGVSLRVVHSELLLTTGDDAFSYTFADFADSCWPVRLLLPSDGVLHDVTASHPDVLRADARRAWRLAEKRPIRTGFLACWAADEERLGADAKVWRTLDALEQQGKLRLPADLTRPGWWKDGQAYVDQLRTFLTRRGYRS